MACSHQAGIRKPAHPDAGQPVCGSEISASSQVTTQGHKHANSICCRQKSACSRSAKQPDIQASPTTLGITWGTRPGRVMAGFLMSPSVWAKSPPSSEQTPVLVLSWAWEDSGSSRALSRQGAASALVVAEAGTSANTLAVCSACCSWSACTALPHVGMQADLVKRWHDAESFAGRCCN